MNVFASSALCALLISLGASGVHAETAPRWKFKAQPAERLAELRSDASARQVPEPMGTAAGLAGAAAVGFLARRRRAP